MSEELKRFPEDFKEIGRGLQATDLVMGANGETGAPVYFPVGKITAPIEESFNELLSHKLSASTTITLNADNAWDVTLAAYLALHPEGAFVIIEQPGATGRPANLPAALETGNRYSAIAFGLDSGRRSILLINYWNKYLYVYDLDTNTVSRKLSSTDLKTINGESIVGVGDLIIEGGTGGTPTDYFHASQLSVAAVDELDNFLTSGNYGLNVADGFQGVGNTQMTLVVAKASGDGTGGDGQDDIMHTIIVQSGVEYFRVGRWQNSELFVWTQWAVKSGGGGTVDADSVNTALGTFTSSTPSDSDTVVGTGKKKFSFTAIKAFLKTYFDNIYSAANHTHDYSTFSGSYADLSNKPTIPTTLAALSEKSYTSLTDKPTVPTDVNTAITVGGIAAGTALQGKTALEVIDLMLYPELFPTLTAPSSSFSTTKAATLEVGSVVNVDLNAAFNQGSISPQYTATSDKRSGLPSMYTYTGSGLTDAVDHTLTNLTDTHTVPNYSILFGANSWNNNIQYSAGVQPKSSKANSYSAPLAGSSIAKSLTITGKYYRFSGTGATPSGADSTARRASIIGRNPVFQDNSAGSFVLATGSSDTSFFVCLPFNLAVLSALDTTANAAVSFALAGTYILKDAGGSDITYHMYTATIGSAFASSHNWTLNIG